MKLIERLSNANKEVILDILMQTLDNLQICIDPIRAGYIKIEQGNLDNAVTLMESTTKLIRIIRHIGLFFGHLTLSDLAGVKILLESECKTISIIGVVLTQLLTNKINEENMEQVSTFIQSIDNLTFALKAEVESTLASIHVSVECF